MDWTAGEICWNGRGRDGSGAKIHDFGVRVGIHICTRFLDYSPATGSKPTDSITTKLLNDGQLGVGGKLRSVGHVVDALAYDVRETLFRGNLHRKAAKVLAVHAVQLHESGTEPRKLTITYLIYNKIYSYYRNQDHFVLVSTDANNRLQSRMVNRSAQESQ